MKLRDIIPNAPYETTLDLVPRPSQLQSLGTLLESPRSADYSQVGTGKSLVSYLYIMTKLYESKGVVVIMPPPLIPQYVHNFGVIKGHMFKMARLNPDKAKRHKEMDAWDMTEWPDVLFLSYQLFLKYFRTITNVRKYKVIVADEAHNVSNTNKYFQATFMSVHQKNMELLLMTATPTPTELSSAYGQIRLKNPKAYASFTQFERLHCIKEGPVGRRVTVGYQNNDLIEAHLMANSVRVLSKDVLKLQDPNIFDHVVELSYKHSSLYGRLLVERMLELGDELLVARNAQALRQMALQIITNLQKFTEDKIGDEPTDTLLAIVDAIDLTKTKVVIFCHFKDTVEKLNRVFKQYNPALVYGSSDTSVNVKKLLEDDTCRVGILNFASGGAGFNLQSVCHNVIIYEAIGSPGMIEQAIGRVHRGGQTQPVVVWMFRYLLTLSSDLMEKALIRADDIRDVLGDEENFVTFIRD